MMKYVLFALLFVTASIHAVEESNGKEPLTCTYKGLSFGLDDPVTYNDQLWVCTYDGGPTTHWMLAREYCKEAVNSSFCN